MESETNTNTNPIKKSNSTKPLKKNSDLELEDLKKNMLNEIWKEEKCIKIKTKNSIDSIAWNFNDTKIAVACWRESIYIYNLSSTIAQIESQLPSILDFANGRIAWHPFENKLAYMGYLNQKNIILFYDSEEKKKLPKFV